MVSNEERARAKELLAEWNRWAACQPLEDDSAAKEDAEFVRMMAEALSAAREAALRGAVGPEDETRLRLREARQLLAKAFRLSRRPAAIEQLLMLMEKVGDYLQRTSDPRDILREAAHPPPPPKAP